MDHPGQFPRGIVHRVERKIHCFMASHCVSSLSGCPPERPAASCPCRPRCEPVATQIDADMDEQVRCSKYRRS